MKKFSKLGLIENPSDALQNSDVNIAAEVWSDYILSLLSVGYQSIYLGDVSLLNQKLNRFNWQVFNENIQNVETLTKLEVEVHTEEELYEILTIDAVQKIGISTGLEDNIYRQLKAKTLNFNKELFLIIQINNKLDVEEITSNFIFAQNHNIHHVRFVLTHELEPDDLKDFMEMMHTFQSNFNFSFLLRNHENWQNFVNSLPDFSVYEILCGIKSNYVGEKFLKNIATETLIGWAEQNKLDHGLKLFHFEAAYNQYMKTFNL